MNTGLQLAIDEILKVIEAKELEILPLKVSANTLARQIPTNEPFPGIEVGGTGLGSRSKAAKVTWRIDHFFNKPLASSVAEILVARRKVGLDGPATVDEIFDDLKAGGFRFQGASGSDENTKRAIKVALTKNTTQFVKIGDETFGLKSWYGAPRGRPKKSKTGVDQSGDDTVDVEDESEADDIEFEEISPQEPDLEPDSESESSDESLFG